ncbi:MAG: phosphatase PAP2 family protein [Nitrospinae bacterium]|nr:phosphatase PAP2 family protein [Nitrospinota bacterium]
MLAFALTVLIGTGSAFAESSKEPDGDEPIRYTIDNKAYWKSYASDGLNLITAPARWDSQDWLTAGTVIGVTGGLYIFDARLQNWVQTNRTQGSNDVATIFKSAGDELYVFPGLALLYLYGEGTDSEQARRTTLLSLQSWFYSSVLTLGVKNVAHRHRPNTGDPYDSWDGPRTSSSNVSFPSGHASTAWSVATVIANEYGEVAAVPPVAYTVATLVSLSRVNDNDHWASDVFFSSASGYFIGKALTTWHRQDSYGSLNVLPLFDGRSAYLLVTYTF